MRAVKEEAEGQQQATRSRELFVLMFDDFYHLLSETVITGSVILRQTRVGWLKWNFVKPGSYSRLPDEDTIFVNKNI